MRTLALAALALGLVSPAKAGELFGGVYVHDVESPLTAAGIEPGIDVQIGYRGRSIVRGVRLEPYGFVAINSAGETHYAAAGLAWKLGERFYLRPGLGVAIHSGSAAGVHRRDRIAFGSRLLIEPELGVGLTLSERASIEASWVHMSHGQLAGRQNPGIDNVGLRLNWRL